MPRKPTCTCCGRRKEPVRMDQALCRGCNADRMKLFRLERKGELAYLRRLEIAVRAHVQRCGDVEAIRALFAEAGEEPCA